MAMRTCPTCGHAIDDVRLPCPNCGKPIIRAGILPSNVAVASEAPPPSKRPNLVVPLVVLVLLVVIAVAIVFLVVSSQPRPVPAATVARPTATAASATALAPAQRAAGAGAPLPAVNGIRCDALESTLLHIHVHLAIFVDGKERVVPYGVGIGEPWQVSTAGERPFVDDGSCFYWLHTHTEDGVVHIESPVRRTFTLGDFFGIWQIPLSSSQVGPAAGPVIAYVNGVRETANPADIRLAPHLLIQLNVGVDVPPQPFEFAPGD
jgi:hypothetical protein